MRKDTGWFLLLLKYYLDMVLPFDFKLYEIDQIYFAAILYIFQLIKYI